MKKKAKFIHISLCFKGDIPEYLHLDYTNALAYYVTRCRGQRVTSRTSAFLSPRGKYFGIVAKEDMQYTLYNMDHECELVCRTQDGSIMYCVCIVPIFGMTDSDRIEE